MALTPEEKQKIYEEEKAKLEAQEQAKKDLKEEKKKKNKPAAVGCLVIICIFLIIGYCVNKHDESEDKKWLAKATEETKQEEDALRKSLTHEQIENIKKMYIDFNNDIEKVNDKFSQLPKAIRDDSEENLLDFVNDLKQTANNYKSKISVPSKNPQPSYEKEIKNSHYPLELYNQLKEITSELFYYYYSVESAMKYFLEYHNNQEHSIREKFESSIKQAMKNYDTVVLKLKKFNRSVVIPISNTNIKE